MDEVEVTVKFPTEDNVHDIIRYVVNTSKPDSPAKIIEKRIRAMMNQSIQIEISKVGK